MIRYDDWLARVLMTFMAISMLIMLTMLVVLSWGSIEKYTPVISVAAKDTRSFVVIDSISVCPDGRRIVYCNGRSVSTYGSVVIVVGEK